MDGYIKWINKYISINLLLQDAVNNTWHFKFTIIAVGSGAGFILETLIVIKNCGIELFYKRSYKLLYNFPIVLN